MDSEKLHNEHILPTLIEMDGLEVPSPASPGLYTRNRYVLTDVILSICLYSTDVSGLRIQFWWSGGISIINQTILLQLVNNILNQTSLSFI